MDKNLIYDYIVKLGGDCFQGKERPPCPACPFKDKCIKKIIYFAENISNEARLQWALDELIQENFLDTDDENTNNDY